MKKVWRSCEGHYYYDNTDALEQTFCWVNKVFQQHFRYIYQVKDKTLSFVCSILAISLCHIYFELVTFACL